MPKPYTFVLANGDAFVDADTIILRGTYTQDDNSMFTGLASAAVAEYITGTTVVDMRSHITGVLQLPSRQEFANAAAPLDALFGGRDRPRILHEPALIDNGLEAACSVTNNTGQTMTGLVYVVFQGILWFSGDEPQRKKFMETWRAKMIGSLQRNNADVDINAVAARMVSEFGG